MRREQQAQPHSSHTTRRHPRKEGTQRQQPPTMHEEKTSTTISPSSSLQPQGNGKNPRPPHQPHAQANPHPSMTRHQNLQPSRPQWDTEPNSTQPHAVHHSRRKRDSGCALTLLLPSPHSHGRRQQPPHATASMHCKRSIQIHCNVHRVCVVVCVCRNTKQRSGKEGAEYVERRTTKMYSGNPHKIYLKRKENDPLHLIQTPSHKIIMNEKDIFHYCSTQI
ncbi:hypothetical protein ECC02_010701 [Trypanosoma cruzi]|uniref:Uncharacterized protein n=1 Tax=Trypanosoma cruzi TaxID=5693 RepID=A0A7J6XQN5_TRYCR|nr:hypothetical protein ECC02_010697 [Trypanosoma cruzi]KAF5216539.1 hypothetical protein ECC02_010701 [Trypanosoma cruzi]